MIKSVYIHVPFCKTICSYCDFCKIYYNNIVSRYLDELENEIKKKYKGEIIDTIYIGGGTPSTLSIKELTKLFNIIKIIKVSKALEFTVEANIEDLNEEKLQFLLQKGVNRLSIGIQTFNKKNILFLNRTCNKKEVFKKIKLARKIGFNNINIDLIYAIPNQTLRELKKDLRLALKLNIEHISTYSLIIEPNTLLYINKTKNIDEDLDYKMYQTIKKKLEKYKNYEISNFAKKGYESKHNLTYWNNLEYYGFGLGASGYINGVRYENTRGINNYLKGKYVYESHKVSKKEKLENEFILGFRKIEGINKENFKEKYGNIKNHKIINDLIKTRELLENDTNIYINPEYIYTSNRILSKFIDS
ncbi:MAG: radical SAM family heme chaperone HemW [Clostridium sp.]|nr:radical SAM family heme chaperone HemW [Clostridium sp.]MCM1444517.1 radical SAM family heme chaperone HemW [Candidatus Amulumruptor caecigallinarius]